MVGIIVLGWIRCRSQYVTSSDLAHCQGSGSDAEISTVPCARARYAALERLL